MGPGARSGEGGSEQPQRHPSAPRGGPATRLPATFGSPPPRPQGLGRGAREHRGPRSPLRLAAAQTASELRAALTTRGAWVAAPIRTGGRALLPCQHSGRQRLRGCCAPLAFSDVALGVPGSRGTKDSSGESSLEDIKDGTKDRVVEEDAAKCRVLLLCTHRLR